MESSNEEYAKIGEKLAATDPGEEIVITGLSGRFPESDNVRKFQENLDKGAYMITNDDRRWKRSYENTPYSIGKISKVTQLDAGFFDMSYHHADLMDPECRQLLERSVEAVWDAGLSLKELQETRTGVYVAATISDSEKVILFDKIQSPHFGFEGTSHSMLAHQISYHLKLNGPSANMDSACSSSLYALEKAYRAIKMGTYDNAIVAGSNVILNPLLNQFFYKLGIVSLDGDTLIFNGNGYIRSESAVVLFIQRAKDARRMYAEVTHIKVSCDGFKEEGITFVSASEISKLMTETFTECKINPASLDVLEGHATGTRIGDPQEVRAICNTLSKNRATPLLLGSVKSSIGHTEPASGLCSAVKLLLGMNSDEIYAHCNYFGIGYRENEMAKNNLKIVTKTTVWPKDGSNLAAVNSYGFGGANGFLIMKRCPKEKTNSGVPVDDLPRLVCFSARSEECLQPIFRDLSSGQFDAEYIRLWHAIHSYEISNHPARGFIILSKKGEVRRSAGSFPKTSLCLAFERVDNSCDVLQQLSKFAMIENYVERARKALDEDQSGMIGSVVVHAVLTSALKEIGIEWQYVTGNSFGVLSAAFADGVLSFDQLISCARVVNQHLSFAHGLTKEDLRQTREKLIVQLQGIMPKSKVFSSKWIFDTTDDMLASAEYIVDRLLCSSYDYSLDKTLKDVVLITFGREPNTDSVVNVLAPTHSRSVVESFLSGLGRIYQLGQNMKLDKLYPKVKFPVSRKTASISPSIEWIHDENWFIYRHTNTLKDCVQFFNYSLKGQNSEVQVLVGHVLDGQYITPISAFFYLVWDTFSRMTGIIKFKMRATFENVEMHKIVNLLDKRHQKLTVRILRHTNRFEVEDQGETIFSGTIALGVHDMAELPLIESESVVLSEEDVYKKLSLRGYNYSEEFCCIQEYDIGKQKATVRWTKNWMGFLDNLLQLSLLSKDANTLDLPMGFSKFSLDAESFLKDGRNLKEVLIYNDLIRADGIELIKVSTKSIPRQKTHARVVTESLKFIPYTGRAPLNEAVQVFAQIILENVSFTKLKVTEIVDEQFGNSLISTIQMVMQNAIGIQIKATKVPLKINNVDILRRLPFTDQSHDVLIMPKALNEDFLNRALRVINKQGFIISREVPDFSLNQDLSSRVCVLSKFDCEQEILLLLRCSVNDSASTILTINCRNQNFSWLPQLQDHLQTKKKVVLFVENDPTNGVLGLLHTLKLEYGTSDKIKCVFIPENIEKLTVTDEVVSEQLKKDLCVNILKNGIWGSQRSLVLETQELGEAKDVVLGKDSQWFACSLRGQVDDNVRVHVHYTSRGGNDGCLEFSGLDETGKRVMGYLCEEQLATLVQADRYLLWDVPEAWTLKEAATVPYPYLFAIYMLIMKANLKTGYNIVLQRLPDTTTEAIVNVAKYHDCRVFIAEGNREKLSVLIDKYKNIANVYVGALDSVHFQKKFHKRGHAQIVLSSNNNRTYDLSFGTTKYPAVDLDSAFEQEPVKIQLRSLFQNGLNTKMIKPLSVKCVQRTDIEKDPSEKVLVQMRTKEERPFLCIPRFYCDSDRVYVIIGGLGGLGLEFVDWLIERGGRRFAISTRSSNFTGYQNLKINSWKTKNAQVAISNSDVTTENGCEELLQFANNLGMVAGIFNLSAALKNELFENHTISTFTTPFPSKAFATEHLDKLSRKMCPHLSYFVVFSSFVSSRGNVGQSNYAMANSAMERVCENRRENGYPATAILLGPIANVGLVLKMANYKSDMIVAGAVQHSLQSCLESMDRFLTQDQTLVLSFLLEDETPAPSQHYEEFIQNLLGIANLNTASHHVTLPQLGLDSIVSFQLQSYLKNGYSLNLTLPEIRNLTLAKLKDLILTHWTV